GTADEPEDEQGGDSANQELENDQRSVAPFVEQSTVDDVRQPGGGRPGVAGRRVRPGFPARDVAGVENDPTEPHVPPDIGVVERAGRKIDEDREDEGRHDRPCGCRRHAQPAASRAASLGGVVARVDQRHRSAAVGRGHRCRAVGVHRRAAVLEQMVNRATKNDHDRDDDRGNREYDQRVLDGGRAGIRRVRSVDIGRSLHRVLPGGRLTESLHTNARQPGSWALTDGRSWTSSRNYGAQVAAAPVVPLMAPHVWLNLSLTTPPSRNTTSTMTAAIAATIRPYSTAVAPSSLLLRWASMKRSISFPPGSAGSGRWRLLNPPRAQQDE